MVKSLHLDKQVVGMPPQKGGVCENNSNTRDVHSQPDTSSIHFYICHDSRVATATTQHIATKGAEVAVPQTNVPQGQWRVHETRSPLQQGCPQVHANGRAVIGQSKLLNIDLRLSTAGLNQVNALLCAVIMMKQEHEPRSSKY